MSELESATILEASNLTKQYGSLVALDGVDFSVKDGEILSVIGPNGAGKTTLFNVLNGYLSSTSGTVTLNGTDVTTAAPHEHAEAGMARTFQIAKPFGGMTVRENVMIGAMFANEDLDGARASANDLLKTFDLDAVADEQPASITIENKKRMELARAMATEPDLLMVDELMAGLDDAELDNVISHLKRINREGCTILLIEHIIKAVVEVSDRVLVLNNGDFIADGTPEEVINMDRVIEIYLGEGGDA